MEIALETYKSGEYEPGNQYKAFLPSLINKPWIISDSEINSLLEAAALNLGALNAMSKIVPDTRMFMKMLVTKEAVRSSRIEGTQTSFDEALLPEAEIASDRWQDWQEVNNYTKALQKAALDIDKKPISTRLFKATHSILMSGVRGQHKMPGEYRKSQNWIGGRSINEAVFVPPLPFRVENLMGDLENFLHNKNIYLPSLLRIAIAHYQFETIHPFLDGNGRIGRLIIPLYLVDQGLLTHPILYLSAFFENDRELYYKSLTRVRTHNDLKGWIKYFLIGVRETSIDAMNTLEAILNLKRELEYRIKTEFGRRKGTGLMLLSSLFTHQWIDIDSAAKACGTSYATANKLVALMCNYGILREVTGHSRNR
ncbi:MAG TPA: Fic family protein, partial [Hellea balneolensis]|nr:Fic family protein [Hellea balneolensis]